ncbi:hypothetical protein BHU72_02140 [Desulfuribacillus stibiiarsenatis]|uniref:Shikimate kinase n=2 Tax=Desulfuribacillus stibiiarsenatis TaxID=1390249 RepID=A0A1E5L7H0_9FIRM|nr:hypothetical protein BHU72_02140 [Desulfuribacillus stibiiarsenatis]
MMGTGKSTIGHAIASTLQVPFIDLDTVIETQEAMKISDIFDLRGEPYFRMLETSALRNTGLVGNQPTILSVVATGGGAFEKEENRNIMESYGYTVWLQTDIDEIAHRLASDTTRPLLREENFASLRSRLQEIFNKRKDNYSLASVHVNTDGKSIEQIVAEIIEATKK